MKFVKNATADISRWSRHFLFRKEIFFYFHYVLTIHTKPINM